jgi:Flp pilus assembly pilin Flp
MNGYNGKGAQPMDDLTNESGATAVEYGLFLALIAGVIIGTVAILGTEVLGLFQSVEGRF